MKNTIFPHKFWRPFLDCMPQLFLDPNMCGFQYICRVLWPPSDTKLLWSIGRINCLYYSTRVDLYSHQILCKISAILHTTFSNWYVWMKAWIWNKFPLRYVLLGPIGNMSALVQIMTWHTTGEKPLSDPMMNQFTNPNIHHSTSVSWIIDKGSFCFSY